jgi:hypothetical protein
MNIEVCVGFENSGVEITALSAVGILSIVV